MRGIGRCTTEPLCERDTSGADELWDGGSSFQIAIGTVTSLSPFVSNESLSLPAVTLIVIAKTSKSCTGVRTLAERFPSLTSRGLASLSIRRVESQIKWLMTYSALESEYSSKDITHCTGVRVRRRPSEYADLQSTTCLYGRGEGTSFVSNVADH